MSNPEDVYVTEREERSAVNYADTGIELVQHIFERTPSKYGFPDFDDVANKNLVVANLSRNAGDGDQIIRKADNIITYKRFVKERPVLVGWKRYTYDKDSEELGAWVGRKDIQIAEEGNTVIVLEPVFKLRRTNRFQDLLNEDLAFIQTLTGVSAGTDAAVLKLMRSTFIQKDQSIEDRTAPKSSFWGKKK